VNDDISGGQAAITVTLSAPSGKTRAAAYASRVGMPFLTRDQWAPLDAAFH
jgi:hypothetical protein